MLLLVYTILCACAAHQFKFYESHAAQTDNIELNLFIHVGNDSNKLIIEQIFNLERALESAGVGIKVVLIHHDKESSWLQFDHSKINQLIDVLMNYNSRGIHIFVVNNINIQNDTIAEYIQKYSIKKMRYYDFIVILNDYGMNGYTHPTTLAHEIGHMFCLKHVVDNTNIMNTGDRINESVFNKKQLKKMIKYMKKRGYR